MTGPSGKYRLDARLGGGGMAEVFLGAAVGAEGFSRKVAIKRVLPGFSENPQFAQMFVAEAQISSRLVHPNIVSVIDFDRDAANQLFLVMELVEGRDLSALVTTGRVPFAVTIYVVAEILRGLGYAHDLPVGADVRGVVHRDISPHNVLLSWEGSVKVSDFGIAKARAASEATASQLIKGKPAYMSPEQANGDPLDGRSDLFAVGIILWEMLVGRQLFTGGDTRSTLAAVLFGQVPRPRSLKPDIPKDVERVAMKLLERDLPARYATAEAAIDDLLACTTAPKNGREALTAVLAERFPAHAPVRQSRARSGSTGPPPAGGRVVVVAHQPGVTPTQDTMTPEAAAALPSLGAIRNQQTGTMAPIARPRARAGMIAIAAGGTVLSAAIAFAVVSANTRHSAEPHAPDHVAAIAPAPAPTPAPPPPPTVIDAAPQPDAIAVAAITPSPPPDAAVTAPPPPPAPTTPPGPKKDATTRQPAHAGPDKKFGTLRAIGYPVRTVSVDGKSIGDMPLTYKLPVGRHQVRLTNSETGADETLTETITENHETLIDRTH